jgi:hypothetical protein
MFLSRLFINLKAGTRLALFLPVRTLDFRVSGADYAMLLGLSLTSWLLGGMLRTGFPGSVDGAALSGGLAQVPLVLLICMLAAALFQRPPLVLAFAVLLTSVDPVFEAVAVALHYLVAFEPLAPYVTVAPLLFLGWGFAVVLRAQWLLTGWRGARSIVGAGLFAGSMLVFVLFFPRTELWVHAAEADPEDPSALLSEDVFHLQGELLQSQLEQLKPERPGIADLYLLSVAAYGLQDTFAKELIAVRQMMADRFDTAGRAVSLVNHPSTLRDAPIASVSNMRRAVEGVAEVMNPDEDLLLLHITTHGNQDPNLAFELPPLQLQPLTPSALARMLADSGMKWKVVVISACFSGGFVEALKDANTLIVTSADARHSSFGCEYESDYTWFSKAFFDHALRRTLSFTDAFEQARREVAEREQRAGFEHSNPQIFVGEAIREKLASLERRLAAGAAGEAPGVNAR